MLGMIPKSTPSLPTLLPFRSCIHWDVGQGSGSEQDTLGCFLCAVRWREQPVRENTKWCWTRTEKACFSLSVFLKLWILDHPMAGESFLGRSTLQKGLLLRHAQLCAYSAGSPLPRSCLCQRDGEEEECALMERRERICPSLRSHGNSTQKIQGEKDRWPVVAGNLGEL